MSAGAYTSIFLALLCCAPSASAQRVQPQSREVEMRWRAMDRNNDGMITRDEWHGFGAVLQRPGLERRRPALRRGSASRGAAQSATAKMSIRSEHAEPVRPELDRGSVHQPRSQPRRPSRRQRMALRYRDVPPCRPQSRQRHQPHRIPGQRTRTTGATSHSTIWTRTTTAASSAANGTSPAAFDRARSQPRRRAEPLRSGRQPSDAGDTYNQFASLDVDGNGTLARNEWHWSLGSFNQRDLNRNGSLSRREFVATTDTTTDTATPEVRVGGNERWADTGITVRAGDVITVHADGTIQMSTNPNDIAVPGGAPSGRRAKNAPIPEAVAGALIAKVGDSLPILVGDRRSFTAPITGRLYLGVNDDHLPDNTGEYRVALSVRER